MPLTKQEIINKLKKEILSLQLKPGTIISEATLTKRFELSRTPIRDVLKQLSLEGYVDIYPQRGSVVSYIDLESVKQIIYLRTTLEKEILKELCNNISQSDLNRLNQLVNKQNSILSNNTTVDFDYFIELDDAFHKTIFEIAKRLFLWNLIQQFNVHYLRYRKTNMLTIEKLIQITKEHEMILNCLSNINDINKIDELVYHHTSTDINSKNNPHIYKK